MKKKLILPLILFAFSCGDSAKEKPKENKTEVPEVTITWKSIDTLNFSAEYPEDWELNKYGDAGTAFVVTSRAESNQDEFRENVNLVIQDLRDKNMDLESYTSLSEEQIKKYILNSNILENETIKNNGEEYQKLIYLGDQGLLHLKFEQYYFVSNNKVYVLTYAAEQSKFKKYREIGERVLNSFKIAND